MQKWKIYENQALLVKENVELEMVRGQTQNRFFCQLMKITHNLYRTWKKIEKHATQNKLEKSMS